MKQNQELSRLIEKNLFDQGLRQKHRSKKEQKILRLACFFVYLLVIAGSCVLFYQLAFSVLLQKRPSQLASSQPQLKNQVQVKTNILESIFSADLPFNVLALGRPGQGYSGSNLTDTIILFHFRPAEKKAVLISLPRDLLVQTPNYSTKINALYQISGIEELEKKVEEITGLSVDYHLLIDLMVVEEIINLVDGLNVYVPQDINDPFFPGPGDSYQPFSLKSGWRYLDGKTALRYIRTRYTSPNGDFDRMARQQQVLYLLKTKVLSLNPLWDLPTYLKIFDSLRDRIETDLKIWQIKSLWQVAKEIGADQINHIVIDKKETNLLIGDQVMLNNQKASVVYPRAGLKNYEEIKKYVKEKIEEK